MTDTLSNTNFNGITPEIKEILDECPDSAKTGYVYYSEETHKMEPELLKTWEDVYKRQEQKLLRVLCENRGKVLKREYLIDEVWQGDTEFVDAHALTVAVKRLRDKLEDDTQKPEYIKTIYGIGYTWAVNG